MRLSLIDVLCNSDDDIASFALGFDIPVSVCDLLQWIASVNHRLEHPRFSKLSKKDKIFLTLVKPRQP